MQNGIYLTDAQLKEVFWVGANFQGCPYCNADMREWSALTIAEHVVDDLKTSEEQNRKNEFAELQRTLEQTEKMRRIAQTNLDAIDSAYDALSLVVDDLKTENAELRQKLEKTEEDLHFMESTSFLNS